MARKDIFDRIDSKMRNQLQTLGKSPRREGDEQEFVDKRVSKRVIRRRARKPRKDEPLVAAEQTDVPSAEAAEDGDALEAEDTSAAAEEQAPEAAAAEEDVAVDAGDETPAAAEETAQEEAAPVDVEDESPEPAAPAEAEQSEAAAADGEEPAPAETEASGDEVEAAAEPAEPAEADAVDDSDPEPEPEPAAEAAEVAEPPTEEPDHEEPGAAEAPADAADAAEPEPAEDVAPAEPEPAPADADEPAPEAAAPAEEAPETGAGAEAEPAEAVEASSGPDMSDPAAPSLEELLREQGIVQHKPKKGRRIIAEAPAPERKPIPKPVIRHDIAAQAALRQARQAGFGGDDRAPGQARNGSRRRGAVAPDRLERELRQEREREKKMHRPKKRGRRKSIVQRPDMMYYPDRRTTRKKGSSGPRNITTVQPKESKRVIRIENEISVGELANQLGVKAPELIRKFIELGQMVTVNQFVDFETATLVAAEFEYRVEDIGFKEEDVIEEIEDADEDMVPRPPVITVMGHVDHGKTSILDAIRKTRVAAKEAGGITQHIGAYQVKAGGQLLTFLDTPGHEAFTAMRARGAEATDLVVLVVAANDGVMPQTLESISHTRAAGVPILVAINKIDIPNANIDRVKQELSDQELVPEDWGGDTVMVPVSATKGTGIKDLLEMIALQAEMLELKANPDRSARGLVIEANLSKGVGPVATVLVQHGTLKVGDYIVAGTAYGRIRAMKDHAGKRIKKATPSTPVEVHGLSEVPDAGDEVAQVEDEKAAKTLIEHRAADVRDKTLSKTSMVTMETLSEVLAAGELKELNLVLKADVRGSVEALRESLLKIEVEETTLNILHAAVGGINNHDVMLAAASGGLVLGFNVRPDGNALKAAEEQGVQIRTYRVIYEALEEIEGLLTGLLEPVFEEDFHGRAEVRETFKIPKIGAIAGCKVVTGDVARNHQARLLRDGVVVWEGKMSSLKRFKDDVKEVKEGYECGIGLHEYNDIKKGDIIETYLMKEVARGA